MLLAFKGEGGRAGGSKHSLKDLLLLEGSSSSWCLDYKVTLSAFSNKWSHQVLRVNRTLADHSVTIFHLHRISVLARGCLLMASRKKKSLALFTVFLLQTMPHLFPLYKWHSRWQSNIKRMRGSCHHL